MVGGIEVVGRFDGGVADITRLNGKEISGSDSGRHRRGGSPATSMAGPATTPTADGFLGDPRFFLQVRPR